ncbi:MAG: hypothetical protein ACPG6B_02410 [Oceanihabitans sp.]
MKNLVFVLMALIALQTTAQEKREATQVDRLNQRADIHVKEMTLALDLNEKQQKQIKAMYLDRINNNSKMRAEKRKEVAIKKAEINSQRMEAKNKRLDRQIALKAKMKDILNAEQYTKWEAIIASKSKKYKNKKKRELHRK